MSEIKVRLTIELPGSKLVSEQECSKQLKVPVKDKNGNFIKNKAGKVIMKLQEVYDPQKTTPNFIPMEDPKTKKSYVIRFFTRKSRSIQQVLNISDTSYEYFISQEAPSNFKGNWKTLSKKARLEWHLDEIAKTIGGKVSCYSIIGD